MNKKIDGPCKVSEAEVRKPDDARVLVSGDETIFMHFWTDRLIFAVSKIPPGGRSTLDPGHKDADEIAYLVKGELVIEFPDLNDYMFLSEGESIVIPQDQPHKVFSPGDKLAVSVWSTAPNLGYDIKELTK